MTTLDPAIAGVLRDAITLARRGAVGEAKAHAEAALQRHGDHVALHAFLGTLCCQSGEFAAGADHLRKAHAAAPDDTTIAANLTAALIQIGAFEEGAMVASEERSGADRSLKLWRLRGYVLQQLERHQEAANAYRHVVGIAPDDWESWNNLGNAFSQDGKVDEAIHALRRAAELCPDAGPIQLNLAATLTQAGRFDEAAGVLECFIGAHPDDSRPIVELARLKRYLYRDAEALALLERAVVLTPDDVALLVDLAGQRVEAQDRSGAEAAYRKAIALAPTHGEAQIRLALLLETLNREDELPGLLQAAEAAGAESGVVQFIRALVYRREGRLEDGLAVLAHVAPDLKPVLTAQLEGQFRDRLGDADGAFAAFTEMNRQFRLDPSQPERRAEATRAALRLQHGLVTPEWFGGWSKVNPPHERPAPVFLVGFPRSGTTLLDTMLMGHPDAQVLEERPPLRKVELALGGIERLPDLDAGAVAALRADYFRAVSEEIDLRDGTRLVDKSPLHMNKVPLIHRLFPDARFILALRHPCDVVLSCFMTAFRLNDAMANFVDLRTAAEYYDLGFGHWTNATSIMPVRVHAIRYEDVVDDAEGQLRGLLAYLGLDWNDKVLDHVGTARSRGLITTASYAQVTEGMYRRASGRWQRYRHHLEPVLPVLAPWAEKFGYEM